MNDELQLPQAEQVDAICDRFEQDFRDGQASRIEDLLREASASLRPALLQNLIALEIELRQKQGEQPQLAEYAQRFPGDIEAVTQAFSDLVSVLSSVKATMADTSRGGVPALVSSSLPLEPIKELGRFQILSLLGEGAFGTVYKAHDPQLDRLVAIKVPRSGALQSSEDRDRFLREARSAAGLHHPQICPVHEVGTIGGRDYIVMAFIDGRPLSKVLQSQPNLSDKQIVYVIRKVARGLQEAHEKGVVHRDLKPANIMINRKGEPVIMDFGLARRAKATDPEISHSGQILGTPAYMSPEQARGGGKLVGPATDIYSLGVIMYEMLCGRRPYEGTVTEVIGQILHVDVTPPSSQLPGVNPQLEAICLKAIAKNPAERYASMKQLAEALEDFLRSLSTIKSQAAPTMEETPAFETKQIEKIFAAVSSDLEEKVEHAVQRHRTPPRIPWRTTLIGSGLVCVMVLFAIVFFLPARTVTVTVELDVDVNDPQLGFFLDEKNIDRSQLMGRIELTPGKHELIVLKDNQVYRRYELMAIRGNDTAEVVVKESAPEPIQKITGPRRVEVSELNLTGWNSSPWLSRDGLTIYFESNKPDDVPDPEFWIWSARRPHARAPFGDKQRMFPGRIPTVSGDGLEMIFVRGQRGNSSLRHAKRDSVNEPFATQGQISEFSEQVNARNPCLSDDGLMLIFVRGRDEDTSQEFVVSTRPDRNSPWSKPQALPMTPDPTWTESLSWPFLSRDGLTLWYCHGRPPALEIRQATRPDRHSPFADHQPVIVQGTPLIGRTPRFVEATGELFYSPNLTEIPGNWSLWVVKDYASPKIEISQDSLIGEWDWGWGEIEHGKEPIYQNEIKFHADGTCIGRIGGIQGKWERTGNQIVIRWANNAKDTVTISEDGRKLDGMNKEGTMPVRGRKKSKSDWTSLFNGKDLTGWKMPPNSPPNPWKVENGLLTADPGLPMSMLITERENYRDVHVRAKAKLESGRVGIKVRAPADHDPHAAFSYTLALFDQTPPPEQGRVSAFKPPLNTWVTLEIIVRGFHVTAMVDGKVIEEYDDPQRLRTAGHIGLARGPNTKVSFQKIEVKELQPEVAVPSPADGGWIDLFNGKTLAGWKPIGPAEWTVRQGATFVAGTKKGHLVCDQTFEDFELIGEVYADAHGNGGVCVRVSEIPQDGGLQRGGYEFQVAGSQSDPGKNYTGGLYADSTVVRVNPSRVDDKTWAQIRLRVTGNRLQGWVDDQPTFDVNGDAARMAGRKLSLQCYGKGGEVGYRNLRIRQLGISTDAANIVPDRRAVKNLPSPQNPECPLDDLDPAAIPETERRPWHPPELAAVLGSSGMRMVALSLAFSPDNTLVAAGGEQEKSVKVWDVATGKEVLHLTDFPGWVTGVAFSPDGKLLYAGSGDEIRVVDLATKKTLHTWRSQCGGIAALALSPDGKLLVAAGGGQHGQAFGKDLELWDTVTGQTLRTAKGIFSSVAFSPDGQTLAVGTWAAGGQGGAALWDVATLTERQRLADVAEAYWVAFSGNGQFVAVAGSTDATARVYEAATGKLLRTIPCQQTNIVRVAFQANGQVLATASDNATVKLWETATGKEIRTLTGHKAPILTLAMTPDGQTLATGAEDGTVRLWEAATGRELFPRSGDVGAIAVSPDGATIATGGATVRLWDAKTGKSRQSLLLHRRSVGGVVFSPDGKTLASGSGDGTVRLWDATTGEERQSLAADSAVGSVAFSRDGRLLAAAIKGDSTTNAKVWDLTTGQLLHTLQGRNDPGARPYLRKVAFSPTESLLATSSGPEILLWDPVTGQKLAELTVSDNEVNDLVFSPDGRRLASCYFRDTLKVWDVATRKEVRTLHGHGDNLSGVAWSRDGKWLASAGADGTVRLWHGESGAADKVFRLHKPSGHLGRLTFSPESRHLLVDSGQGTVYVLRLWPPGSASAAAIDPDHRAAEWVIRYNTGTVRLTDSGKQIVVDAKTALPKVPFELIYLDLWGKSFPSEEIENLRGLKHLKSVGLHGCQSIDDRGLAILGEIPSITMLSIGANSFTGEGLSSLVGLKNLHDLNISENPRVDDQCLRHLTVFPDLARLGVNDTSITDDGVKQISKQSKIRTLGIARTHITGTALDHLANLPELDNLNVDFTALGDDDAPKLARLKNLTVLRLAGTNIGDAGVRSISELHQLRTLVLNDTPLTNEGLKSISQMTGLRELWLVDLRGIDDAGVPHLSGLKHLRQLFLSKNNLTDACVEDLGQLKSLTHLTVNQTQITATGLKRLAKLLPNTVLTPQPEENAAGDPSDKPESPRAVAEWVIQQSGKIRTSDSQDPLGPHHWERYTNQLPVGELLLKGVHLGNGGKPATVKITDDDLKQFRGLTDLKYLDLGSDGVQIHGGGIQHLVGLPNLDALHFYYCPLKDEGLVHIGRMPRLRSLRLDATLITDEGVAHLKDLTELRLLFLGFNRISGEGLKHLAKLTKLEWLSIYATEVTDDDLVHLLPMENLRVLEVGRHRRPNFTGAGLAHLKPLKSLRHVDVFDADITDDGLKGVAALENLEVLNLLGTKITDAGLKHLNGMKTLRHLNLSGTQVTEAGVQQLKAALPDCTIVK